MTAQLRNMKADLTSLTNPREVACQRNDSIPNILYKITTPCITDFPYLPN
jgi:hypothetical protein